MEGLTILRAFRNAPYPHASRENGWTYGGKTFSAAAHYSDSTVGVFIPAGYRAEARVDYVVHFHGHGNNVAKALERYDLRRLIDESGLNAILLVPQGPKNATDSGGGHLELDEGAFEALIREVTGFLKREGHIGTARIGRIALTSHSGGYKVTSAILRHGGLAGCIRDVLLFDSTYASLDGFADWIAGGRNRRLISIFTQHLAGENLMLMSLIGKRKAPFDVFVEAETAAQYLPLRRAHFIYTTELEHDEVVSARGYFADWLRSSALSRVPDRVRQDTAGA